MSTTVSKAHGYVNQRQNLDWLNAAAASALADISTIQRRSDVRERMVDAALATHAVRIPSAVGLWARLRWLATGR
jgi:hypothetical protein